MIYDAVIIGAGLSGLVSALKLSSEGKKVVILSRGLGNLYSSSGFIDLLGYYPTTCSDPVLNPLKTIETLISQKPDHPYSLTGIACIKDSFDFFVEITKKIDLPYSGSINRNILMPTAAGMLVPTTFYPLTSEKNLTEFPDISVCGIRELIDFSPSYVAHNLEVELNRKIRFFWTDLGLNVNRELNSYDIALFFEKEEIRKKFVQKIKAENSSGALILLPAVLGGYRHTDVVSYLEEETDFNFLEIPTLPPSLMGYRLGEALSKYLKKNSVELITGFPVDYVKTEEKVCLEVGISTAGGKIKKFRAKNFILATGGILGEGLQVYPEEIREKVFDLPVSLPEDSPYQAFFDLRPNPLSCAGLSVNEELKPVNEKGDVIFYNVFVAGASLGGYDPFLEKSGNGVALTTGYKAALMALRQVNSNE